MTSLKRKRGCSIGFPILKGTLFVLLLLLLSASWFKRNHLTILLMGPTVTISEVIQDPPEKTFYDDPQLSYSIEKRIKQWDKKRSDWLHLHPSFAASRDRILIVTGSQSTPCKNNIGDHLLLRCFKNKVDYCRIQNCEVYYSNVLLHPKMGSYWSKIPSIRSAMMAHPEVEWIWWLDADAVITDMEFKIPLERYKDHNLVVHGWSNMVYDESENKSWTGLNAGSLLIRNCQWSMDLLHVWSQMGPLSSNYETWGRILTSIFKDKLFPVSDDQSSLIYLLSRQRRKWGVKTYLEEGYDLEGYWIASLGKFERLKDKYDEMEDGARVLRRRHSEKVSVWYGEMRERYLGGKERRPFVTHFTGCQPCSGDHNPSYEGDVCWKEMERALNFGDNQVLRNYGFVRKDLMESSVYEVPFGYPRVEE
ncbi:unnamed protein product [Lathyrus sativus]|nr:unnamed protein product [Lathyrus sativus]